MQVFENGWVEVARTLQPNVEPGSRDDGSVVLADDGLSKRFCAWRGVTGQRYVASVFAADPKRGDCGLPSFDACILMAVARGEIRRSILSVCTIEKESERRAAIACGKTAGVDEWHVHFLASTPHARAVAAADLAERHLTVERADCA